MKKKTTLITTFIAVTLSLLWIFSFGWSIQDFFAGKTMANENKPTEAKAPKKEIEVKNNLTVVALGDSLTRGTGDEAGKGYVGFVTENLEQRLKPQKVTVYNLGINGQTSTNLLQQLAQPNVKNQISSADVILMTIGGNDLFQKGDTLYNLNMENVQQLQQQYLSNLEQIFSIIRQNNNQATVFILGLYNPFIDLDKSQTTNEIIRTWNYATEAVTGKYDKIVFVPTFDLFQLSVNDYLYSDHFHPNQAGYHLISDRLAPLIHWEKEVDDNG